MTPLSLQPTLLATLALFLMDTLPSQTKSLHFLNPASITFVNFAVSAHALTSKQPAPLPPPLSTLNSINVTLSITTFQTIKSAGSNGSRTFLLVLLLRLLNTHVSLPFSNLATGLWSTNGSNINVFVLPTKFLQVTTTSILTLLSLSTPSHYLHCCHPFSPTNQHPHWKSQIAHSGMHHSVTGINSLIHSVSLASHVLAHFFIHLLAHLCLHHHSIIHHSFTLSLQAQNLPFK